MGRRKFSQILRISFALSTIFFINYSAVSLAGTARHTVKKVWYSYDTVKIYIDTAEPGSMPRYRYNMIRGNRFYIDILDSRVETKLNSAINLDDVRVLRRAQFDPNTSRVVIQFNKSGIKPKVRYIDKPKPYILVSWRGSSTSSAGRKFRILIDPGHGGRDIGAVGPVKKIKEKDITLDIALKLEEELLEKRDDVIVKLTRRTDINIAPSARRELSSRWKPDIFISIHANSNARNKNINQTEIYYYDKKSLPLAKIVRDELIGELRRSEGHIRRLPFLVINKNPATYGSVLVESCYISSRRGENLLSQDWYRKAIAKGLLNSINVFLNTTN